MQKRCPISSVVLAALCWTLSSSSSSMFLLHQGIRYSTCGLTRAEGKDHLSQPAGNTPPHAAQDTTQPSLLQGPIADLPAFSEFTGYLGEPFRAKLTENLARCSVIILFSSWSRCSLKSSHCRTSVPQDTLESTWCKSGCKLCKLGKALTEPSCFKTSFWASLQLVGSCSIAAGKYGLFNSISSLKCVSCPQKICLQTAKSPMEEQIYSFFQ